LALLWRERTEVAALEQVEITHERRERRGELVRDVAQEVSSEARHLLETHVGRAQLPHLLLEALDDAMALLAEARLGVITALAVPEEEFADGADEALGVDGLLDEAVGAHREARLAVALGRDRHDGDTREPFDAAEP